MTRMWVCLAALICMTTAAAATARAEDKNQTPQPHLEAGLGAIEFFDFKNAYTHFARARQFAAAGSPEWQRATFGMAISAQQIAPAGPSNINEARDLYLELLNQTPASPYAARATLNLGRIAELRDYLNDVIDLKDARSRYQKVIDQWPDHSIAGEATLRLASSYIANYEPGESRQGIAILKQWLEKHPKDPLASGMWQYLGDTYFEQFQEYRPALDAYLKADEIGLMEKGREGLAYWRMAVIAERQVNDLPTAIRYYTKIVTLTPTSGKGYESQVALRRLGAPVPELILSVTGGGNNNPSKESKP